VAGRVFDSDNRYDEAENAFTRRPSTARRLEETIDRVMGGDVLECSTPRP